MNLHRNSTTSVGSNISTKSSFAPQQPLFCFEVYIHQIHFNLNSYFEDMSQYPFTLGFRLWDFPLVYMELPMVQKTPCPLKRGKSCLFHLPSLKKMYSYLNSFPLYFFLFQNKSLMGAASISLQEMKHNNLASSRTNYDGSFISVLSGKFKLLTLEGYDSGSVECDFRLRHVVDRNKLQYQAIQHLNPSKEFITKTMEKEFLYEDQKDRDDDFVKSDTLHNFQEKEINSTLDSGTNQSMPGQNYRPRNLSSMNFGTNEEFGESIKSIRENDNVNNILRLIDAYKEKQNDAEDIKRTLQFTLRTMKEQLNVVEKAVVEVSKKPIKRRKWKKQSTGLSSAKSHSLPNTTSNLSAYMTRTSTTMSSTQVSSRPSSAIYSSSQKGLKPKRASTPSRTSSHYQRSKGVSKVHISSGYGSKNKKPIPFAVGHVATDTPTKRKKVYSSSSSDESEDISGNRHYSSKSQYNVKNSKTQKSSDNESLDSSIDESISDANPDNHESKVKSRNKPNIKENEHSLGKPTLKEIVLDDDINEFEVQDANPSKSGVDEDNLSFNEEELEMDKDFLNDFEAIGPSEVPTNASKKEVPVDIENYSLNDSDTDVLDVVGDEF